MDKKNYHIDNIPASASDIINKAKEYNEDFGSNGILQTSIGAGILRDFGHIVGKLNN